VADVRCVERFNFDAAKLPSENGTWSRGASIAKTVLPMNYGFVFEDEANAFFITAENFAQLQISEPSSQRVGFDRSIDRFAAEDDWFLGINIIGGPTG
jgi:hypothetical protein